MKRILLFSLFAMLIPSLLLCSKPAEKKEAKPETIVQDSAAVTGPNVTFVELGSVNCIPCKMMQPVMEEVEKQYGAKVEVIFHDVWTDGGKPFAQQYKIRVIPTQVFLDAEGNEFFRHEGFFPKEEIDKLLQSKGIE